MRLSADPRCKLQAASEGLLMCRYWAPRPIVLGWLLSVLTAGMAFGQRRDSKSAPPKLQISGAVVNAASDDPVAGAVVEIAYTNDLSQRRQAVSDAEGRFSFSDLVAGKYAMEAAARGFRLQGYNQHEQFSSAVAVGVGLNSEGLTFRLQPDGAIFGHITDEYGDPVQQADVLLFYERMEDGQRGMHFAGEWRTDNEGSFNFAHLPPGEYKIAVTAQPWYAQNRPLHAPSPADEAINGSTGPGIISGGPEAPPNADDKAHNPEEEAQQLPLDVAFPITFYPNTTEAERAETIVVRGGEKARADLVLHAVPTVHFIEKAIGAEARVSLSQTVFDHSVELVNVESASVNKETAEIYGAIPPGHYTMGVEATHWQIQTMAKNRLRSKREEPLQQKEVDLSSEGEVSTSPAAAAVSVEGKVQLTSALPKNSRAAVRLFRPDIDQPRVAEIDDKGHFVFPEGSIRPGRYYVFLLNAASHIEKVVAQGARMKGRSIELAAGDAARLTITAAPGMGTINGVALQNGKPVAGAMVLLAPPDPEDNLVLFRRDQSDTDGSFTLPDVVPGKYTLLAIANGWELEWANPEVLTPYLAGGTKIEVGVGVSKAQVKVQ